MVVPKRRCQLLLRAMFKTMNFMLLYILYYMLTDPKVSNSLYEIVQCE